MVKFSCLFVKKGVQNQYMKKFFLLICLCLGITASSHAYYADWSLRMGAYFCSYHKVRFILARASPTYQVEVAGHFGGVNEPIPWQVWANATYMNNRHQGDVYETRFAPFSLGLKYTWDFLCNWSFYAGAGASYGYLHFRDKSVLPKRKIVKTGWGALLKSGLRYEMGVYFAEVFADYLFMEFAKRKRMGSIVPHRLSMNGAIFGGALGCVF